MNKECRLSLGGGEKPPEEFDKRCIECLLVFISDRLQRFCHQQNGPEQQLKPLQSGNKAKKLAFRGRNSIQPS